MVYLDVNLNATLDAADTKLPGVTVTLSGTTSTALNICSVIASCIAITDANGSYSFKGLPSGTYSVTETQPSESGTLPVIPAPQ
ncbi:MAG: SdrD B-like domain-containing protein [Nitrosomonadales bacterium]